MDYDTAVNVEITKREAQYEIEVQHGLSFADFTVEYGNKETYIGFEVLDWLGY